MAKHDDVQAAALREALQGQLAYLLDEVEALQEIVGRVPDALLAGRPVASDRSIKEIYGLLAVADEQVFLPLLQQVAVEEEPVWEAEDETALVEAEAWNEVPMPDLLHRVTAARGALVAFLQALPPEDWHRQAHWGGEAVDVYDILHAVTQRDADLLRVAGYRLHESHLTERPQDLPK